MERAGTGARRALCRSRPPLTLRVLLLAQRTGFDPARPAAHGSAAHVAATLAALAERFEVVPFFAPADEDAPSAAPSPGRSLLKRLVPAHVRGLRHDLALLRDDRRFERLVLEQARQQPPAAVYARCEYMSSAALRVARRLGVPLVLEVNGLGELDVKTMYRSLAEPLGARLERRKLAGADEIVTVTPGLADLLVERGADPSRITVVPNTVPVERVAAQPAAQLADGDVTVVWIGHLMPWHLAAVTALVEAAPGVLREAPAVRFLVIGGGPGLGRLRRRVAELGLAGRFDFSGPLPQADVPAVLARCQVGVIPWVFDYAFPVKLAEMGAAGLPVATPRSASLDRLLEPGREYEPFAPHDRAALVEAIVGLALDRERRERLGRALHEAVRSRFTWRQSADATLAVVERALNRARGGGA